MGEPSRPVVRLRRRAPRAVPVPPVEPPADPSAPPAVRRQRRRRFGAMAAAAALLLVCGVVTAIASSGGGDDGDGDDLLVLETPSTRPIPRSTTTTTVRSVTVPIVPLPPTPVAPGRPAPLAPRPSSDTTVPGDGGGGGEAAGLVCRDSTDPACGDFYWDPAPAANDGLAIAVAQSDVPFPGRTIRYTVTLTDTDATLFSACEVVITDGTNRHGASGFCGSPPACVVRYGPWTPPAEEGASFVFEVSHLVNSLGPYAITVTAQSHNPGCGPYDSSGRYG